jgi:hypothetical protein
MAYEVCERRCDMKAKAQVKTVRRSAALSRRLVEDGTAVAPPEPRQSPGAKRVLELVPSL